MEYKDNNLQFGKRHNKMESIWEILHPLKPDEAPCSLSNHFGITEVDVVFTLKESLKKTQTMLCTLNMAPSTSKDQVLRTWLLEFGRVRWI